MRLGFDVSQFNAPKLVPWHRARFACIRATSGIKLDTLAAEHVRRAAHAGIEDLLVYAYLSGAQLGEAQGRLLLERAHELEDQEHVGPLAIAIDVEDPFKGPPWHPPTYAKILTDAFEWIEANTSRGIALYVSPAYVAKLLAAAPDLVTTLARMRLWLADWTPPANVPKPWARWDIWQNEVREIAPGFELDHDLFDGDRGDWRRTFFPDPHDELGGLVTTTRQALGHGPGGVEDFVTERDEGPTIR